MVVLNFCISFTRASCKSDSSYSVFLGQWVVAYILAGMDKSEVGLVGARLLGWIRLFIAKDESSFLKVLFFSSTAD